ncbi:FMN-dependent NADH-azoreductase [Rhodophyticola sp.]|jgi:FMN-dependent NADH-azoreductase|uniref:FMN-dependent NADH-azoreductase n=1 Tax=Rhodophyticola sp. TaxID=2680032 RepID=UPI003D2B3BCE
MKILHVDASARTEGSHSRKLSAHFVKALRGCVPELHIDRLDLAVDTPRHFGALETAAISIPADDDTADMRAAIQASDDIVVRVLAADALVVGTPIYNFSMPSPLKAFFDHLSRNGKTFVSDETGVKGLLGDKRVAVLSTAGGAYGTGDMFEGLDCLTPYFRAILGFMGVTDMRFVAARPMMFAGPDAADAAMASALDEATALAEAWSA